MTSLFVRVKYHLFLGFLLRFEKDGHDEDYTESGEDNDDADQVLNNVHYLGTSVGGLCGQRSFFVLVKVRAAACANFHTVSLV